MNGRRSVALDQRTVSLTDEVSSSTALLRTAGIDVDVHVAVAAALEPGTSPLTAREADVLHLTETGASTEQIAATLYLSPATVRNYLSNAIAKLNARSRIDAIRIACQAGWL